MSEARKSFEALIESLRKKAEKNGTSVAEELMHFNAILPAAREPFRAESNAKGLMAIIEQAMLQQAEQRYYEWLANELMKVVPSKKRRLEAAKQKQREAGLKRQEQRRRQAVATDMVLLDHAMKLIREGVPERAINKQVHLDCKVSYRRVQRLFAKVRKVSARA